MRALLLSVVVGVGGCVGASESACGDAAYWSARAGAWPGDALFVGERELGLTDALELLEGEPQTPSELLAAALIVAELNLASGADPRVLPLVYEGHALLADDVDAPEDALALASALAAERVCGA